ncbi:glycosyltransferase family 2 protein [Aestuariimicrobium ganziense]|uniref:glycosyltransferase family 2 protein n=1 Tax=Aestuariimicrobium ganziense TaxID=2773677 RepID=UPI00194442AC|nr:glycosyltransferase family A protein [Aestuariimicrobium ganziense]
MAPDTGDGRLSGTTAIVISYNHEAYVTQCLASVVDQTTQVDRVIFVDDASRDGSAAAASQYLAQSGIDHLVLAHEQNRGLCSGLNEALSHVDTEFYFYISADDTMEPHRLGQQLRHLARLPSSCAACYSDAYRIDATGDRLPEVFSEHYRWPDAERRQGNIFGQLLLNNWIPAPSVLLRTAAVREVGGYDEDLFYEDYDLWLRLAERHTFAVVNEPLVSHRVLDTSLGSVEFGAANPRFLRALVRTFGKHVDHPEHSTLASDQLWKHARELWSAGGSRREVSSAMWSARRTSLGRVRYWGFLIAAAMGLPGTLYRARRRR